MFQVSRSQSVVSKHLGGSNASTEVLSDEVFSWLDAAAIAAESMIKSATFPPLFQKFSQVDEMSHTQVANYPALVQSCIEKLVGITICVAPLGREYAMYIRPGEKEKVTDSMNIYLNTHFLLHLHRVYQATASNADEPLARAQLEREFIAFLAAKLFHESNHLLLTLADDADLSMHLIGVTETGEACTPAKRHFGSIFKDFGCLMERACFGGILLMECWQKLNFSHKVVAAKSETLKSPVLVPTIVSIGEGVLSNVVPEEATGEPSKKRARKSARMSSGTEINGRDDEGATSCTDSDAEGAKKQVFLPVSLWSTARRVPTARP